jgi:hypothetical protein
MQSELGSNCENAPYLDLDGVLYEHLQVFWGWLKENCGAELAVIASLPLQKRRMRIARKVR